MDLKEIWLFLDNVRTPKDAFTQTTNPVYLKDNWDVVINFKEFKDYVLQYGVPKKVSFSHDLAEEHYVSNEFTDEAQYEYYIKNKCTAFTGRECLAWLILYCKIKKQKFPEVLIHGQNPIGVKLMKQLLRDHKLIETSI